MNSMLLFSNRRIQQYFLVLLAIHMSLGCLRFLFPFQILNLGGNEILNQYSSTLFAVGQILGCGKPMHIEEVSGEEMLVCWMGPSCGVQELSTHYDKPMKLI